MIKEHAPISAEFTRRFPASPTAPSGKDSHPTRNRRVSCTLIEGIRGVCRHRYLPRCAGLGSVSLVRTLSRPQSARQECRPGHAHPAIPRRLATARSDLPSVAGSDLGDVEFVPWPICGWRTGVGAVRRTPEAAGDDRSADQCRRPGARSHHRVDYHNRRRHWLAGSLPLERGDCRRSADSAQYPPSVAVRDSRNDAGHGWPLTSASWT